ncbi:MAG: hypothetical protein SO135_03210 [Sphaerochaetaceae bacterium]|nr:hypothetical protein [Sphaerochaetaceae bacterium]
MLLCGGRSRGIRIACFRHWILHQWKLEDVAAEVEIVSSLAVRSITGPVLETGASAFDRYTRKLERLLQLLTKRS